jgi:ribosomal protein S18 acetylase RimI-like enzyme
MSITIRPVTVADVPAVRVALVETWHATYDGIYGPEKVREITTRWHSLVALANQIDAAAAFLLAERNGAVLASSFAKPDADPQVIKLYRLYVHPRAQRTGIGRQLMAATFAAFPGALRHRLEVNPQNAPAIRFYHREGFVKVGEISDEGRIGAVDAFVYERGRAVRASA